MSGKGTQASSCEDDLARRRSRERENHPVCSQMEEIQNVIASIEHAANRKGAPLFRESRSPVPLRAPARIGDKYVARTFCSAPAEDDENCSASLSRRCPACAGEIEFLEHQFQVMVLRSLIRRQIEAWVGRRVGAGLWIDRGIVVTLRTVRALRRARSEPTAHPGGPTIQGLGDLGREHGSPSSEPPAASRARGETRLSSCSGPPNDAQERTEYDDLSRLS